MSSTCCHKRVGRIFFRSKSDPYILLSHALGSNTGVNQGDQHSQGENTYQGVNAYNDHLNTQVHLLVSHLISEANTDASLSTALDVEKFFKHVQCVAPDAWEHVCLLTHSVNECKGRKSAVEEDSLSVRIKHLRRAFLLSVVLFCTNAQCCYPFHVQLADAVECCGGSTELITILNRLGVTASLDTLKRHIHSISEKRKQAGIDGLLVDKAFTVASADNIDFLSSYAAVYAGCQHRSWQATSVQLVQPRPQSCMYQSQPTDDSCDAQETLPPTVPTPITVPTPVTVTDVPTYAYTAYCSRFYAYMWSHSRQTPYHIA